MPTKLYKILILIIFSGLLNIFMISCEEKNIQLKQIKGKQVEINQFYNSDTTFIQFIQPYKNELQSKINTILCYSPRVLTRKESELESSLGNIFADICFQKADSIFSIKTGKTIDFALFNYDGIRTVIPKGNIRVKNIFELMPFENMLVVAELSGEQTQALFNYLEKEKRAHPISHLKIELKGEKLNKILIQDQPFDLSKKYHVLTHDYLQHGGDHMDFFKNPLSLYQTEYKVRDALISYLTSIDTLRAELDGRFVKID